MHNLEDVCSYLDNSGYFTEAIDCQCLLSSVTQLHIRAKGEKQSIRKVIVFDVYNMLCLLIYVHIHVIYQNL